MQILKLHPFFRKALHVMNILEEHEQWSRSDLTSLQLERINQVWHHAINHVPYYAKLFREHDLPREFHSVDEYVSSVPILEKATVRSGAVFSQRANPGRWYHTGGSTGIPLAIYRERSADLEMLSAQYRLRDLWGVGIFDPVVMELGRADSLVPGLSGSAARLRCAIEDALRNRVRLSPHTLGRDDLRQDLRMMNDFKPRFLYGHSSSIYLLALEALETGMRLESLRLVVLTAEVITQTIRNTTERAFPSASVVQEYGAAESLVIAYEDRQHLLRVREDIVMVETIPTEDNHYRIIMSVLNNPSFPLLRYNIGDLTDRPIAQTDFGFATLGPIIGRNNDFLVARSGRRVRLVAATLAAHISKHHASVKRFRAHQLIDGRVLLYLEVDSPTEQIDTSAMQRSLAAILEGQPVEVRLVRLIPPISSGKHAWLTSELAHSNTAPDKQP